MRQKNMKLLMVIIVLACLSVPVFAQDSVTEKSALIKKMDQLKRETAAVENQYNPDLWFSLGRASHDLCNQFGEDTSRLAIEALEKSKNIEPRSVTLAYLGSAWTLAARDTENPLEKIDFVLKGIALLDKAVESDPSNVVVRRIRYENSYALPDIFERKKVALEDVNYLLRLYAKNPDSFRNAYDPAYVFYYKALLLTQNNDWENGRKYAVLARKIVSDKDLAIRIEKYIKGDLR